MKNIRLVLKREVSGIPSKLKSGKGKVNYDIYVGKN